MTQRLIESSTRCCKEDEASRGVASSSPIQGADKDGKSSQGLKIDLLSSAIAGPTNAPFRLCFLARKCQIELGSLVPVDLVLAHSPKSPLLSRMASDQHLGEEDEGRDEDTFYNDISRPNLFSSPPAEPPTIDPALLRCQESSHETGLYSII